jgi:hypothetical protein
MRFCTTCTPWCTTLGGGHYVSSVRDDNSLLMLRVVGSQGLSEDEFGDREDGRQVGGDREGNSGK